MSNFRLTKTAVLSDDARRLVKLGQAEGWQQVRYLCVAPMPQEVVHLRDYVITPAHLDTSPIPRRAFDRVQQLLRWGVPVQGLVVIHEAPKLLPGGRAAPKKRFKLPSLSSVAPGLRVVGLVTATLAAALFILYMVWVLLPVLVVAVIVIGLAASGVDPILVAVTSEDEWIEIDRWAVE